MLGSNPPVKRMPRRKPGATGSQGWIASVFPESKAGKRSAGPKSCFAVHSCEAALHLPRLPRKFPPLKACRTADFAVRGGPWKVRAISMNDHYNNGSGQAEPI